MFFYGLLQLFKDLSKVFSMVFHGFSMVFLLSRVFQDCPSGFLELSSSFFRWFSLAFFFCCFWCDDRRTFIEFLVLKVILYIYNGSVLLCLIFNW